MFWVGIAFPPCGQRVSRGQAPDSGSGATQGGGPSGGLPPDLDATGGCAPLTLAAVMLWFSLMFSLGLWAGIILVVLNFVG
jgi:hypothetical protein